MFRFSLPDPGEGLVEADVVQWLVAVGDTVKVNDPIIEIETAKSLVELPSPVDGVVRSLLVQVGDVVEVGNPIIEIDDGTEQVSEHTEEPPAGERAETGIAAGAAVGEGSAEAPAPMLVGYGPVAGQSARRRRRTGGPAAPQAASAPGSTQPEASTVRAEGTGAPGDRAPEGSAGRTSSEPDADPQADGSAATPLAEAPNHVRSAPVVRRLARDLGLDLDAMTGTGPEGIVTRDDVVKAVGGQQDDEVLVGDPAVPDRVEQVRGVRRATANNLVASIQEHVHASIWTTFDITASVDLLAALRGRREFADVRLSMFVLVANAVRQVLPRYPTLNASWLTETGEIGYHDHINLGFAAATPRGLMVPNVKHVDQLDLLGLARGVGELITAAREGRLTREDMSGGTFTITNVGVFGVESGTPVINGRESAILCLGKVERKPWVVGEGATERIEPRWVTTMSISIDHRLIDGEQGAKFLAEVTSLLAQPGLGSLY